MAPRKTPEPEIVPAPAALPPIDWEAVEREYRAGQLSVAEIGRQQGVSHTAINKRAKKYGWTRSLATRVREEVSARLVSDAVSEANARETIDAAAARAVEVVRSHRKDIFAGREMVAALLSELGEATTNREAIADEVELAPGNEKHKAMMRRAVALPSRASTILSLSGAMKNLVGLERQAFNLGPTDEDKAQDGLAELLQRIDGKSRGIPG